MPAGILCTDLLWKDSNIPPLEEIAKLRHADFKVWSFFCEEFLPCVVGKSKWNHGCASSLMSTFVTVTDEALTLLLLENSWDTWHQTESKSYTRNKEDLLQSKWTVAAKAVGRFGGWKEDGLERFNDLVKEVRKNRLEGNAVEVQFLASKKGKDDSDGKVHGCSAGSGKRLVMLNDLVDDEDVPPAVVPV
jgi:hypothetical protein